MWSHSLETRPRTGDLDPVDLELLRRTNAFDIELCAHARSLFDRQLTKAGPAFGPALARVQREQRDYESRGAAPMAEPSLRGGIWRL